MPTEEVRRDPGGSARDGHPVHAMRAGAHPSAQARGAEGEGSAEGIVDLGPCRVIPGGGSLHEASQLRAGVCVGIVGEPLLRRRH